jgi:drug/metabolite transporter (DMT)-like permease
MNYNSLIWSLLTAIVSTTYFFLIKYYIKNRKFSILVLVVLLELLVIFLYYKSLKQTGSAIIYAIINAFSVLLGAFIATIFFGEKITKIDIIGILFVVFGIIILGQKRSSVEFS